MRIVDVRERTLAISRYADPAIPSGGLTTSIVAVVTDTVRNGRPVIGYGFASVGRFGQGGLIRERFAPRLLAATALDDGNGGLDPLRAWSAMMAGEKPGGHGERCVAVGTLDMAIWDAAAKIAGLPLSHFLAKRLGRPPPPSRVPVYAGGGYRYPADDAARLSEEIRRFADLGFTRAKIKIGGDSLVDDLKRIEIAASRLGGPACLAVDAMNVYDPDAALEAARALAPLGLWWFEDICDPLDFATHARAAAAYPGPIAAGEALFSRAEARLLAATDLLDDSSWSRAKALMPPNSPASPAPAPIPQPWSCARETARPSRRTPRRRQVRRGRARRRLWLPRRCQRTHAHQSTPSDGATIAPTIWLPLEQIGLAA